MSDEGVRQEIIDGIKDNLFFCYAKLKDGGDCYKKFEKAEERDKYGRIKFHK